MKFIQFLFFCSLNAFLHVNACNKRNDYNHLNKGHYSAPGKNGYETSCSEKRKTAAGMRSPESRNEPLCGDIVPGLQIFEHGVKKDVLWDNSENQSQNRLDTVLYLSCTKNISNTIDKYKQYLVPTQIKALLSEPDTKYTHRIVGKKEVISTLEEDILLLHPKSKYVLHLPVLNVNPRNLQSAGYLSTIYTIYTANLKDSVEPHQTVLNDYYSLPENFMDNPSVYFHFVEKYGTDILVKATFGGSLILLVTHDEAKNDIINLNKTDNPTPGNYNEIINKVIKLNEKSDDRVSMHIRGGMPHLNNVDAWLQSVNESPVPIVSTYQPINEFLEKNTTKRKASLAQMLKYEEDLNLYQKMILELQLARAEENQSALGQFMLNTLRQHLNFVCSSPQLNSAIEHGILQDTNLHFNKYKVTCITPVWWEKDSKEYRKENYTIEMIPQVCFTLQWSILSCEEVYWQLPKKTRCLRFFTAATCEGVYEVVYDEDDMKKRISKMKSFMMCP